LFKPDKNKRLPILANEQQMRIQPKPDEERRTAARLDTLIKLRWLAILGQASTLSFTSFVLGFAMPIGWCFAAVAASVWLNLALRIRFRPNQRVDEHAASLLLAFDVLQLAGLLFLTGGIQNPFAMLFLAPVMISAVILPVRKTLLLLGLTICCATLLLRYHYPLPWMVGEQVSLPSLYVAGIWLAVVISCSFVAAYGHKVADEARRLNAALQATELAFAREQHLIQLDGLAAAAAHELGTPLATIALVAKELQRSQDRIQDEEDLHLLDQQVQRCRAILAKLNSVKSADDQILGAISVGQVIEEVVDPLRTLGVPIAVNASGDGPEPSLRRTPGIIFGLRSFLENAIDFARSEVRVQGTWSTELIEIEIHDDGLGFAPEILQKVGEPYVTTRPMRGREDPQEKGLGLGIFIAKNLLERAGANVVIGNAVAPETGARIRVVWRDDAIKQ
jgi:two-component system sensor histidine kinase RegB